MTRLGIALFALLLPVSAQAGDAAEGRKVFERFCKQCHEPFPGDPLAAPRLNGVIGKPIASSPEYRYSDAFVARREDGFIWTEQNLRDFLRDPRGFIPGSVMVFQGLKRGQHRDNMIAYIQSLPPLAD